MSRFTGDSTRALFGLRRSVAVIPNGIDTIAFQVAPEQERDEPTILYLGSIVRKKGVIDLCRAFSRLADRRPEMRLVLVGRDSVDRKTGRSTWELCEAELSEKVRPRVEYLGAQPYERIPGFIGQASVCAFPSYAEACPLSWLEVMACGKSLVGYDLGWAREVVETGTTGVLVRRGDVDALAGALESLLDDDLERRRIGEAARRSVEEHFDIGVVARRSVAWYEEVLSSHGAN